CGIGITICDTSQEPTKGRVQRKAKFHPKFTRWRSLLITICYDECFKDTYLGLEDHLMVLLGKSVQRTLVVVIFHMVVIVIASGNLTAQQNLQPRITQAAQPSDETTEEPAKLFEPRVYVGEADAIKEKKLNYRLLKPKDFDPAEKYPLVIFLHGAGERGDNNVAQLKHAMSDFCRAEIREAYPCYVLAPQCPKEQRWADVDWSQPGVTMPSQASQSMQLVLALVDEMVRDAAIDKQRIYITGLSMGGYGTWDAIARRPNFFAAAVPVCGGGDPSTAGEIKHLPISCFHGSDDKTVSVEKSRLMIQALQAAGGEPIYTEYAGVGHDSWTQTYADRELYRWLFAQRRSSNNSD
ncbi:MAG: prolyl oligopeptidase family serine peptidase, partial [Planctomycetales bacterium]|nr:prolyl oligopeptidase family serine peptidase [Planctomycetales bacterium]